MAALNIRIQFKRLSLVSCPMTFRQMSNVFLLGLAVVADSWLNCHSTYWPAKTYPHTILDNCFCCWFPIRNFRKLFRKILSVGCPPYGIFCDSPFLKPSDDDYVSRLWVCLSQKGWLQEHRAECHESHQSSPNWQSGGLCAYDHDDILKGHNFQFWLR